MARMTIRYLVKVPGPSGGLPRWFWRPGPGLRKEGWKGQRVPLDWASYSEPAALEAAAIARAQELNEEMDRTRASAALAQVRPTPPAARTLSQLIVHYKQHGNWQTRAAKTQRSYQQCLDKIELWAGDVPVRAIQAHNIQKLLRSLDATPAFRDAVGRVVRLVLEHGRRHSWITTNPAIRPGLIGSDPSGLIWPPAAIAAFVAAADRMGRHSIGTAVMANEWLGQREADILRMPRSALRNGTLLVRQAKTRAGVALPVSEVTHLVARLEAEIARVDARVGNGPKPLAIIVSETTGLPYKEDNFRHVFAEIRAAAAKACPLFEIDHLMPGRDSADPDAFKVRMQELTFMQLRHTAVTRLGEAEVDPSLISAISGHSLATVLSILERYMVRTAKMARLAFRKRVAAEGLGAATVGGAEKEVG